MRSPTRILRAERDFHPIQGDTPKDHRIAILLSHEGLCTFLDNPEVSFDNNHAERQIRPAVIARKNSYANGSEDGAETQVILMSVFRTLKQRGHNPVFAVTDAVRVYLRTGQLPTLPKLIAELG